MTLYEVLKSRVQEVAQTLSLPLGWEGEVFTPPHAPHMRGKVNFAESTTATLGAGGLTRTDGNMELTLVAPVGENVGFAATAMALQAAFPRGTALDFTRGTVTLGTPATTGMVSNGSRLSLTVSIPFWAFSLN